PGGEPLDHHDGEEGQATDRDEHDEGRKELGRLQGGVVGQQQIAQPCVRGDELGDHGTDHTHGEGQLQTGEQVWNGRRDLDMSVQVAFGAVDRGEELHVPAVGGVQAADRVDEHGEERQQRDDEYLRSQVDPEPQYEQGGDGNLRDRL